MENDEINLGDSIQLSGFKEINSGEMIIIKKMIGSQVRKFQDMIPDFERLKIYMKSVHKTGDHMQYEIHADLIHAGKIMNAKSLDRNLFVTIADVLNKLENSIKKYTQ